MTALNIERLTKKTNTASGGVIAPIFTGPIADNVIGYAGGIAVQDNAGYIRPARAGTTTDVAIGIFRKTYDNTVVGHVAGAFNVDVERGGFLLDNDTGNPVLASTQAGTQLYCVDDHTVSLSSGGTRSVAGTLIGLDPDGSGQVIVFLNPVVGEF